MALPETMKAVQVTEFNGPYRLNTVPVPRPTGAHDLIVKVAVASYCHTDGMVRAGAFDDDDGDNGSRLPMTAFHEGAGTVAAVGAGVTAFRPGDRVMCGLPLRPCGACDDCAGPDEGHRQYCVRAEGHVGVRVDGCLAEYVRVNERFTTLLPDQVSFLSAAPLACAGRTVWRALLQTGLDRPGQWIAIVGAGGGLGHLGVQFARAKGLRVAAVDARDEGLELARRLGADVVADARGASSSSSSSSSSSPSSSSAEDVVARVRDAIARMGAAGGGGGGGEGGGGGRVGGGVADATMVLSDAPAAAALGAALTRMHGTMVQVAQPDQVVLPFQELVMRDVRVRGSALCSPRESADMVAFVARHGGGSGRFSVATVPFGGRRGGRGCDGSGGLSGLDIGVVEELLARVEAGRLSGKAVVVVDPEQVEADERLGAKI